MVNKWAGAAIGLIGGQVVGRGVSVLLSSGPGERLLEKVDRRPLTPLEHRVLAQKWSGNIGKALSAAIATLALSRGDEARRRPGIVESVQRAVKRGTTHEPDVDSVQLLQRVAEVLLALGAIFKVVGQYLEDRRDTAAETQRAAAKRLA